MNPPLAIVGASARAAAASAVRAGFQPVTADLFADADLRRIATATRIAPYPDGFLDWLRTIEPPAWMYTGALENHPELVDQLAWIAPLWGNPGEVLQAVRSPLELARVLGSAGLLFPETRTSAEGLPHDGTWLAKTYSGASGSGVRALGRAHGAESREPDSSLHALGPTLPAFFQRRIDGIPCAAAFVAADGAAALLGITRQLIGEAWLGAHGFQFAGSIGPLPISDAARDIVKQVGNLLAARFELMGLFGVDFILAGDEVWTLEVNPRYTASVEIVERIHNIHAIALHAAACGAAGRREQEAGSSAGSAPHAPSSQLSAHGKAILFAKEDLVISQQFAEWSLAEAVRTPWPTLADVCAAGTPIEAGRPILTVFAEGNDAAQVERHLRERIAEIERMVYEGKVIS